jgi:acyl dehydratase
MSEVASERLKSATSYVFKDEDIEREKWLVGQLHPVGYRDFNTQASHDSLRNFARSYGDDNPLYTDLHYGRRTRWAAQIGPPMLMQVMNRPLLGEQAPKRTSLRGIQVFVSGSSNTWYQPVRDGDILYSFGGLESFTEKESEFAGRSFIKVVRNVHMNQRAEIVGIDRTVSVLTERKAARDRQKYGSLEPAQYTPDDIERHDAIYAAERPRGSEPRYWEDVAVGDEMQPLAKGPLTVTDFILFHAGGYGYHYNPATGRIGYRNRQRIPAFYIPNDQGVPDIAMRLHWDKEWAQANGNPMPYDYGVLRDCWMIHLLTDWMGDDAWIMSSQSSIRKFNYLGDLHVMHGEVTGKDSAGTARTVDVAVRGVNQRGDTTCTMTATVALPSREAGPVVLPAPPDDLQQKAVELMQEHRRHESELPADSVGAAETKRHSA